jgi:hypothetical protein
LVTNLVAIKAVLAALLGSMLLIGCSPQVGSQAWCEKMADKPKVDWTAKEAGDYARHCIFETEER